ncbi:MULTISPECIES: hypothetical protein [Marinobacter]|uniref:Uncharacterized protein n=1 Tax=Marinobacter alkaliphilus TaxID=254719 RepID=A0ABZ3E8N3_9GAMM|nr:hypothetical protein [Marinobacter shengliensis]
MLKALWRKLGVDTVPATGTGCINDEFCTSDEHSGHDSVRVLPHITHTGEFHLERLTQLLNSRYGQLVPTNEHSAVSDQTLKDIVGFASRIQDQDIQRELLLFYLNCSPVIQEFLRSETALGQEQLISP